MAALDAQPPLGDSQQICRTVSTQQPELATAGQGEVPGTHQQPMLAAIRPVQKRVFHEHLAALLRDHDPEQMARVPLKVQGTRGLGLNWLCGVWLYNCLSIHPSIRRSVHPLVCPSVCPSE